MKNSIKYYFQKASTDTECSGVVLAADAKAYSQAVDESSQLASSGSGPCPSTRTQPSPDTNPSAASPLQECDPTAQLIQTQVSDPADEGCPSTSGSDCSIESGRMIGLPSALSGVHGLATQPRLKTFSTSVSSR
ncbi:hypothetical protein PBY51_024750 [Eleginops maclovinus]|uniref:Uncharacterized protein n=1 Tax=Eleginops maclovinus TaxID=56733 RepID=A0AAN8AV80_ELEMC|nr:hypothetical protein PBY51_024750 [Eleginops maclovinus]